MKILFWIRHEKKKIWDFCIQIIWKQNKKNRKNINYIYALCFLLENCEFDPKIYLFDFIFLCSIKKKIIYNFDCVCVCISSFIGFFFSIVLDSFNKFFNPSSRRFSSKVVDHKFRYVSLDISARNNIKFTVHFNLSKNIATDNRLGSDVAFLDGSGVVRNGVKYDWNVSFKRVIFFYNSLKKKISSGDSKSWVNIVVKHVSGFGCFFKALKISKHGVPRGSVFFLINLFKSFFLGTVRKKRLCTQDNKRVTRLVFFVDLKFFFIRYSFPDLFIFQDIKLKPFELLLAEIWAWPVRRNFLNLDFFLRYFV